MQLYPRSPLGRVAAFVPAPLRETRCFPCLSATPRAVYYPLTDAQGASVVAMPMDGIIEMDLSVQLLDAFGVAVKTAVASSEWLGQAGSPNGRSPGGSCPRRQGTPTAVGASGDSR